MIVIKTDENSKILEIDNTIFDEVKEFLKKLSISKKSKFSYIDDFGDKIVVIDGKEYVVPTAEDIKDISKKSKNDFIDEDEVKRILNV